MTGDFEQRLRAFYDGCDPAERRFLASMSELAAAVVAAGDEAEVAAFQHPGSPVSAQRFEDLSGKICQNNLRIDVGYEAASHVNKAEHSTYMAAIKNLVA